MAKQFSQLEKPHIKLIEASPIFFVGTAGPEGRVNVSPKGMDSLRVMSANRIIWMNLTGSGNETAGHLRLNNRMTLMWCSFSKTPMILRTYGTAKIFHRDDAEWEALAQPFPESHGNRQVVDVSIDLVQSSCGFAVPFMEFAGERDVLRDWATTKGEDGIRAYWDKRNGQTIDGYPTGTPGL